jgi:processive 1,2-diacylglycerol beta-glucosyltransferase
MKVLVLTLSFGSGHLKAARSIAQEIKRQSPLADVRVCDALKECKLAFRASYVWPYWMMIRHAPAFWDRFFTTRVNRQHYGTAPEWAFRWGCPSVFDLVEKFGPDTIVATEVAACEIAVIARRQGLTRARIVNVITDYEAEPVWVKDEVDMITVPDEGVREQLLGWSAPPDKIVVSGIPVDPTFTVRHDRLVTRQRYGASDPDTPLVLLMGGGMGPTRMDQVAERLIASGTPMHIVAVTGHDKIARGRLARLRVSPPVTMRALGWTNDVAALMQAASVLVTKPGGLTVAEAAICGLPSVLFDPIPGPEQRNAKRLLEAGAGVVATGSEQTAGAVISLLCDHEKRAALSANVRTLANPFATAAIAHLAGTAFTSFSEHGQPQGLAQVRRMTA